MTRVVHFSDLHLGIEAHGRPDPATGINQRVLDFAARMDEVVQFSLDNDVDVVLFAGDAFKNSHPAPTVQKMLAQRVRRLAKAGIHVFLLAGNHDLPRMIADVTAFSVYSALETENVTVAERAGLYRVRGRSGAEVQIAAIPHFWPRALLASVGESDVDRVSYRVVSDTVAGLAAKVTAGTPAILTAHLQVWEAQSSDAQERYDTTEVRVPVTSLKHEAFGYTALGHVHQRQEFYENWRRGPLVAYSGSLDRVDFGEQSEDKGFYVLDYGADGRLARAPEFRSVAARRFLTIRTEPYCEDPTPEVVAAIERAGIDDAVVRVYVAATRDRYAILDKPRARQALGAAYEGIILPSYPDEQIEVRDARFAAEMTYQQALTEYARSEYGKDADEVIRLGAEVIEEVLGA
jgi:DNA repair protein SbcD/Mre11